MENECIMRVSILEITFPLIVETLGNGNKFAYYLKIFENRLVSVRTKFPDILKHSHGYIIRRNDRPISFVNPDDKVSSFSHLDGGIFVIYRIFSRSFEKIRILSGYEKLFLRNSLEKRRFHPCY